MAEPKELTFKTRDGAERTCRLNRGDIILDVKCPVDGTPLIQAFGTEDYYVSCRNCRRNYHCGSYPPYLTQERVNEKYHREIEETRQRLETLRKNFGAEETRLLQTIQELGSPFTQD